MGQSQSVGVHDGAFHADEVTACALLFTFGLIDRNKIIRTRDPQLLRECEFVCDVGGIYDPAKKLFDHHQSDYQGLLSSAGMVLLYLYEKKVISQEEFDFFNNSLILGVDAHDNGRSKPELGVCSFSHVIANFSPICYESTAEEQNRAFFEAFDFCCGHLRRLLERFRFNAECRQVVADEMRKDRLYLYFDRAIPWFENFFALGGEQHRALFLVMPSGVHWKVRAIPPDYLHRMDLRMPLPASWAGLLDEQLRKISGIEGAIFCHKGRFTSVWATKEAARAALKKVFEEYGIQQTIDF